MLSLSVPRLASLAPTTSSFTLTSHRSLRRKPISVAVSTNSFKPSFCLIASFKPSRHFRRVPLAAEADSAELDDEFQEVEDGVAEEESESGPVEVETGGEASGEGFEMLEEGGELGDEEDEEEYNEEEYDEEDERAIRAHMVLKFIWMEKNIGLALEKVVPGGKGSIPLTPYYFWPRKDAWEELKAVLEEKRWVSQKRMIILLNQATDIINLWQQSGAPTPTA